MVCCWTCCCAEQLSGRWEENPKSKMKAHVSTSMRAKSRGGSFSLGRGGTETGAKPIHPEKPCSSCRVVVDTTLRKCCGTGSGVLVWSTSKTDQALRFTPFTLLVAAIDWSSTLVPTNHHQKLARPRQETITTIMLASTTRQVTRRATTTAWTSRSLATATWSNSLSFASPEADFSGYDNISSSITNNNKEQRFFYSSSSPAAAATNPAHYDQQQPEWWSNTLSFASPESDFTAFHNHPQYEEETTLVAEQRPQSSFIVSTPQVHWSNTISFASPESDFTSPETVAQQSAHHGIITPYPETFAAALRSSLACVVTKATAPHTIVAVNTAWTDLCGYSADEVVGKTLGDLIQGPATNQNLAAATVHRAMAEKSSWVDMYLVNYKKDGSSFTNHVSLKEVPLNEDEPTVRFLLGVLEPVERAPLRMIF
jgi:PAS domain S-box-containing protein